MTIQEVQLEDQMPKHCTFVCKTQSCQLHSSEWGRYVGLNAFLSQSQDNPDDIIEPSSEVLY